KPPSYSNIKLTVNRALQYRARMKQFHGQKLLNRDAIIGQDPRLMDCLEIVARASETDDGVLVTGETGTGKQLIAQAIHNNSSRRKSGFITVDCPNLPENLIESLLFGHIKGSFTGAQDNQQGMIQQAHEGTLFLDEVGDLHPSGQKSLLSVLQSKRFRPLGAKEEKLADFRVISATNKPVSDMVEEGRFRKDLYFRLFGFHIDLPPLRERPEDIKLLVNHYLNKICEESGLSIKGISNDYLDFLVHYEWPGNIRELINVMRTSIANARQEPVIYPHHLPLNLRVSLTQKRFADGPPDEALTPAVTLGINHLNFPDIKLFRQLTESIYLEDLVKIAEGNIQSACKMSGVSRSGLYLLLEKHGKKLKKKG
ncbi:MAG: sigma-54-dependent Fis family transcriptional regulator, partial [Aestuariibacter sp.]|nr:sigma-54-dependent Fis family transcriptional regulator [Aestuariibacter sp.]